MKMTEKPSQAEILKEADRFSDFNKCKREPVYKFPLDLDSIPGLNWQEGGEPVAESVNFFLINCFFTFIKAPESLPGSLKTTLSKFILKYPEVEKLTISAECFNSASLDNFTEALAKQLVKMVKGREVQTKDIKTALIVFGLLGGDKAFAVLFKGKVYSAKHRRGLKPIFDAALRLRNSPYTGLLYQFLEYNEPSLKFLKDTQGVRKILTNENLLSDKNSLKKKKLKEYQLASAVGKHAEKLIIELYHDIIQDYLFLPRYQTYKEWKSTFVDDLCGLRVTRSTIWGLYDQEELQQTFSVDLHCGLVDSRNESLENRDFDKISISPVHPIEMTETEISAWQNYFSETGIAQLVEQLSLPLFRKKGNPMASYLSKPDLLPDSFWKRKMSWWYPEEESGLIYSFKRDFVIKNGEQLTINIKTHIDRSGSYVEALPSLEDIQMLDFGGKTLIDRNTLTALPDRTYSELCRELEKYFLRKQ